jgi:uracil-DNA glycosylase family 4
VSRWLVACLRRRRRAPAQADARRRRPPATISIVKSSSERKFIGNCLEIIPHKESSVSTLNELYTQIRTCTKCDLSKGRTNAVPGEGPTNAEIMFIGEAPGFHEDREGRPFVGAAGKYLDELLALIGMERAQVYICNVIKCRPPQNRDPLPEEMEACKPYLDQQIELIQPKVVLTISRFAMARWFPDKKISEIHGKPKRFGNVIVLPMYHPAAALHQPSLKRVLEEDFKRVPQILKEMATLREEVEEKPTPPPQQMSLF